MYHSITKSIIIIEDDEILQESYKYYIESYDNYKLVGTYSNVEAAFKDFDNALPDIILSDISMPGMSGIKGVELFKEYDKDVKIIMISVHDDYDSIINSINNSADGYLTKPINKTSLSKALQELEEDGAPLSSDVAKKIIKVIQKNKIDLFTERENEIMDLFTKGCTYKDISQKLFISTSTVNYHAQSIYTKLNVNSKSEAILKMNQIIKQNK